MNCSKRFTALLLAALILVFTPHVPARAEEETPMDVEYTLNVSKWEKVPKSGEISVFENDSDEVRRVMTDDYDFTTSQLMVFNGEGIMTEVGENLYGNKDGTYGSPQTEVDIPPHGFMIVYRGGVSVKLLLTYGFAFEGAMLYNSTMTVVRRIYGSYDKEAGTVTIKYNKQQPESENCKSFLFVGNSTTYFNGIPLKFRAICAAAGIEVSVTYCTFGSAYLSEFADENHERGKALRKALAARKYDYVVIQDAGGANFEDSQPAMDVLIPLIRENGAEPLLYMRYSSTSDDSARTAGAVRHYQNYIRLAKLYGLRWSPVAVAFEYCRTEHREINLYAADNSHHSKEGSYLAAATLMYSFFGVSPVGNTYTAYMPQDIVDVLQAEAAKAVETDFEAGRIAPAEARIKGKKYINLAYEKPYTVNTEPYSEGKAYELLSDIRADGTYIGKLTDGMRTANGNDVMCGVYKSEGLTVTVDLGKLYLLASASTDIVGGPWAGDSVRGAEVTFEYSADGVHFRTAAGTAKSSTVKVGNTDKEMRKFNITGEDVQTEAARYVRVTYSVQSEYCGISEIEACGTEADSLLKAAAGAAEAAEKALGGR